MDPTLAASLPGAGEAALSLDDLARGSLPDMTDLGETIRSKIGMLRDKTSEMTETMKSFEDDGAKNSDYADSVDALTSPTPLSSEMGGGIGNGKEMPGDEGIDSVMDRYSGMVSDVSSMAYTSALFTVGSSLTTKVDGTMKMFIQAQ